MKMNLSTIERKSHQRTNSIHKAYSLFELTEETLNFHITILCDLSVCLNPFFSIQNAFCLISSCCFSISFTFQLFLDLSCLDTSLKMRSKPAVSFCLSFELLFQIAFFSFFLYASFFVQHKKSHSRKDTKN